MEFKTGQPVLVRDSDENCKWEYALFSYKDDDDDYSYHVAGGSVWGKCIPYKGNESLVGTDKEYKPFSNFQSSKLFEFIKHNILYLVESTRSNIKGDLDLHPIPNEYKDKINKIVDDSLNTIINNINNI